MAASRLLWLVLGVVGQSKCCEVGPRRVRSTEVGPRDFVRGLGVRSGGVGRGGAKRGEARPGGVGAGRGYSEEGARLGGDSRWGDVR